MFTHEIETENGQVIGMIFPGDTSAIEFAERRRRVVKVRTYPGATVIYGPEDE